MYIMDEQDSASPEPKAKTDRAVARLGPALAQRLGLAASDLELIRSHRAHLSGAEPDLRARLVDYLEQQCDLTQISGPPVTAEELAGNITAHYNDMLAADIGPVRTARVLHVGRIHAERGIPQVWIGAVYAVLTAHLEDRLASLRVLGDERRHLRRALLLLTTWDRELQVQYYDRYLGQQNLVKAQSEISRMMVRQLPLSEMVGPVCRMLVEEAGFALAWIGRVGAQGAPAEISASSGQASGFIESLAIGLEPAAAFSGGPFGRAAASRKRVVMPDLEHDESFQPWWGKASRFGLASAAAFPIMERGALHSVLVVYGKDRDTFTSERVSLLASIAQDLSQVLPADAQRESLTSLQAFREAADAVKAQVPESPDRLKTFKLLLQKLAAQPGIDLAYFVDVATEAGEPSIVASEGRAWGQTLTLHQILGGIDAWDGFEPRAAGETSWFLNHLPDKVGDPAHQRGLRESGVHSVARVAWPDHPDPIRYWLVLASPKETYFSAEAITVLEGLLQSVATHLADQAHHAALEQLQQFHTVLSETSAGLAMGLDTQALLELACNQLVTATDTAMVYLATVQETEQQAQVVCAAGEMSGYLTGLTIPLASDQPGSQGMVGQVYHQGEPVVVPDVSLDPRFAPSAETLRHRHVRTAVGLPVRLGDQCRAVMVLGAPEVRYYSDARLAVLKRLMDLLGSVLAQRKAEAPDGRIQPLDEALIRVDELIAEEPEAQELFEQTCAAIAQSASNLGACIAVAEPDAEHLQIAAYAGALMSAENAAKLRSTLLVEKDAESTAERRSSVTWEAIKAGKPLSWHPADGNAGKPVSLLGVPILCDDDRVTVLVLLSEEPDYFQPVQVRLTERIATNLGYALKVARQREILETKALTDPLTGLPNRNLCLDRLHMAMAQVDRSGGQVAVGLIDLDNFKEINDRLGHAAGDSVIKELATRVSGLLREGDTLARFGGDEMILILPTGDAAATLSEILDRILSAIRAPLTVEREQLQICASIGVAIYPQDAESSEDLLRRADLAMYRVKGQGGNGWTPFEVSLEENLIRQNQFLEQFSSAFEKGEIVFYYQPQVDMKTGRVTGAECLARWQHPEKGLLLPGEWIDCVERNSELVAELGRMALVNAVLQLQKWHQSGRQLMLSVNIGIRHLLMAGFLTDLKQALALAPEVAPYLALEVTETGITPEMKQVSEVLNLCHQLGVHIILDDFGKGMASLSSLQQFPAEVVKIDQSYVLNMLLDVKAFSMVMSTLQATNLSERNSLAEGVETEQHGVRLLQVGCRYAQGFAISQALAPADFENWLDAWKCPEAWHKEFDLDLTLAHTQLMAGLIYHTARFGMIERTAEVTDRGEREARTSELRTKQCPLETWLRDVTRYQLPPSLEHLHLKLHREEGGILDALANTFHPETISLEELRNLLKAYENGVDRLIKSRQS